MTGAPPYNAQSPTQQHRYPPYESPTKNRPFYPNGEQPPPQQQQQQQYSQHPPQTPPAFGPSSVTRSPRFSHASPMPPLNGAAPPPHPESSSQYQAHGSGPPSQLPLPRPFGSSVLSGNGASPYGTSTPHGHPSGHPDAHSKSPTRESESPYHARGNGAGYATGGVRETRAASPQRASVRTKHFAHD